ncbi:MULTISPECIES: EAL domain-containing protein [unclassified Neorhizobium]|uniref:bifunctional diguanylate cyclase/phosphodiesterase n=2 Tax=unclassified Neorhizobium TaxID=2629175 RepID=UPI001FF6F8E4|nr:MULTISPECIES: EAL domain-containing protein [unclassified Neorhizobium]MCJ9670027.1 EAL domain-containing protein [Neorhizobium sp. SHOUNA12B]MCJ9745305.1 EAL domain-containing protein [Neorhizobium sp. SHOUNA12A]
MTSSAALGNSIKLGSVMLARRPKESREGYSVFIATSLLLLVAVILGGMGAHVVDRMRSSANALDDNRAILAAEAAVSSFKGKLAATVRDNAVWDEAYKAITQGDRDAWTYENWGKTSADYALYDGVVLTAPAGGKSIAYLKANIIDPNEYLGAKFRGQTESAARPGMDPTVNFFRNGDDIIAVASEAVQPFGSKVEDSQYYVLSFFKTLTSEVVAEMAKDHQLPELHITYGPAGDLLNLPLMDVDGVEVVRLAWPSAAPGNTIFDAVRPFIAAAIAILGVYLVGVLYAGWSETRRLKSLADRARHEATHDSLSGLLNRLGLIEGLDRLMQANKSQMLVLHLIDLDGFKAVNDAWGHAIGDQLIRLVAEALRDIHPDAAGVARLGGDEFALIQLGSTNLAELDDQLLERLKKPFLIEGRTIEIGASIGVASRDDAEDAHELLRRADMALYEAKETGRGCAVTYHPDLDRQREKIAALESELRRALQKDEIQPVFQPLASAASGDITGVEALARWRRAEGAIGPDAFIPLAEKCGLIDTLGLQMLRKSIVASKAWAPLSLSVNVSPIQLCNPNFAGDVLAVLEEEGFDPSRLTLEITEAVLMSNPEQARRSITALKSAGIRFALDDFGAGYASIGTLREFGFDRMKIDRSLVQAMDDGSTGRNVLTATISLAMALGIPVTAEGIESADQADALRVAGCDQLQGYLVGRPMGRDELVSWLASSIAA